MKKNSFTKMHGLGNEYIVLDSDNITFSLTRQAISRLCNKHYGIGSDGIVLKVHSSKADFGFRVYNPDGSEAEKSGNGLRIFCKYLYDKGLTNGRKFSVETLKDVIAAEIVNEQNNKARLIQIDMGKANFSSERIHVVTDLPEFTGQKIIAGDRKFEVNCVSVGNPHCVIIKQDLDEYELRKYGPLIENHQVFPDRINVQFARVISENKAQILIWERGAGFTLASGSSSCAVSSVLVKRGLLERENTICMPGGELKITINTDWEIRMTGEAKEIVNGVLSSELIDDLDKPFISA